MENIFEEEGEKKHFDSFSNADYIFNNLNTNSNNNGNQVKFTKIEPKKVLKKNPVTNQPMSNINHSLPIPNNNKSNMEESTLANSNLNYTLSPSDLSKKLQNFKCEIKEVKDSKVKLSLKNELELKKQEIYLKEIIKLQKEIESLKFSTREGEDNSKKIKEEITAGKNKLSIIIKENNKLQLNNNQLKEDIRTSQIDK
jgi:hypothetical protein